MLPAGSLSEQGAETGQVASELEQRPSVVSPGSVRSAAQAEVLRRSEDLTPVKTVSRLDCGWRPSSNFATVFVSLTSCLQHRTQLQTVQKTST
jgi:hypothetical protein